MAEVTDVTLNFESHRGVSGHGVCQIRTELKRVLLAQTTVFPFARPAGDRVGSRESGVGSRESGNG